MDDQSPWKACLECGTQERPFYVNAKGERLCEACAVAEYKRNNPLAGMQILREPILKMQFTA